MSINSSDGGYHGVGSREVLGNGLESEKTLTGSGLEVVKNVPYNVFGELIRGTEGRRRE